MTFLKHTAHWPEEGAKVMYFVEPFGRAIGCLRIYDDEKNYAVMEALHVSEELRSHGIGRALQEIREETAKEMGFKWVYLRVRKGSWMRKWYARRGYKWYSKIKGDKMMWLRKRL